jgi:ABC-2 type transport system ATP-binding protein
VQRHVGYLPDNPIYYDFLRGREILQFVAEMHGMGRHEAGQQALRMLSEFGLDEVVDEFAVNYSMGMKKKLGLACALIHDPQVSFSTSPSTGWIRAPRAKCRTACASRQPPARPSSCRPTCSTWRRKVCTRVGIIHRGELIAAGTLDELRERVNQNVSLEEVFLKVTDEGVAAP